MKKHKHKEDKLTQMYYDAVDYFEKNKNRVYTILTIIVVVIAAVFFYFKRQSSQEEEASNLLMRAQNIYFAGSYQEAIDGDSLGIIKGLFYIVDNYGSAPSGQNAKILLANSYYNLGNYDDALKYYNDYSGKNKILKAVSLAGIAAVHEAKSEFKDAASYFEKAASVSEDTPNNDEYLYNALRNYFSAKDSEMTGKIIKGLKKDYPKSKYISMTSRYEISK